MKRGFTLVELAIVVVIAGILAAVAIPIYQGLIDDSKWSEAKTACGTIRQALDVYKAKKSGSLAAVNGAQTIDAAFCDETRLDAGQFDNLKYFDADDFAIAVDSATGTYTITVVSDPAGNPDAPAVATYSLNSAGTETGP